MSQAPEQHITIEHAFANAARLLAEAELELTNLQRMERLEKLADSWILMASWLIQRERGA